MICIFRFVLLLVILISVVAVASAQVQTGMPQFASLGGGPDVIDLANLNVHYTIPIRNKPGRGTPFVYNLDYDSSIWTPQPSSPKLWVQPPEYTAVFYPWNWQGLVPAGQSYITYSMTYSTGHCGQGGTSTYQEWQFAGITYVDLLGNSYSFSTTLVYFNSPGGSCPPNGAQPPTPQPVTSGGYTLYALAGSGSLSTAYVVDSTGTKYYPPVLSNPPAQQLPLTSTDRNGNQITSSSGSYTDTLGQTALGVVQNGSTGVTLSYPAPNGGTASYVATYRTYSVKTNFGCTVVDFGPQNIALMDKITLPDGSYYQFGYEATAGGSSGQVTGRIASIQFPTGGTISYTYQTNNSQYNGITCADGSAIGLTRTMPDGSRWTYARTAGTGSAYATRVTDPLGNDTIIQFQGIYETQRDSYNGSGPTFTSVPISESTLQTAALMQEVRTCYNGNTTNCTSTGVSSAITQRNVTSQFGSSGLQCLHIYKYTIPSTGAASQLSEVDDYDYASGTPTTILRKIFITYASLGSITNMPATVSICTGTGANSSCGGAGTLVAQTTYTYDQGTPATSSGTPQHVSVSGSRGNATTIAYLTQGSGTISNLVAYFDTGMLKTVQDANSAVTTFNYADATSTCGNAFATSITEPLNLSRSFTWNCTGGVQLTSKDENNQTTTTTYSDPYFWRPASESFPDGGQTSWTYNSQISASTTNKMNSSQNIVSTVLLDGLGRTSQTQLNSDPEGVDYSVVTYDGLGRPYRAYNPTRCNPPTTNCGETTWGYRTTLYDPLGRVTQVTLQDGSAATASYSNNTMTATDPAGKKRQSTFDALGRLTQVNEDPSGLNYITTYGYDALGDLLSVTQNGGRQRTFGYDAMSRLTSESNPETGTITYKYDSDSNCASPSSSSGDLISRTDARNIRTCYQYDTLHRLAQKNYSDGITPSAFYAYDGPNNGFGVPVTNVVGRMTEAWTGTSCCATQGAEIFGYDPMGRITVNEQFTPTLSYRPVNYSYDLAGNLLTGSNGVGVTISYAYDTAGRPVSVTSNEVDSQHPATLATVDSSVGYYPPGALRKMTPGNGLTQTAAFNNALQPCRVNVNSSGTALGTCADAIPTGNVQDFNYTFSAGSADNGNVASWTAAGQQAFTRSFGYDSLNRLSSMQETNGSAESCKPASSTGNPYNLSWTYDAWGNRNAQTPSSGTCNFSQSANSNNQLGSPYQYDAAGNMTNDGNHTYFYDAENRLIQVDGTLGTCSTATACYWYDAFGQRVESNHGSWQMDFIHDLGGKVVTDWETSSGFTGWATGYVYLGGQLLAEYANSTTYFAHPDHLSSTRLLTAEGPSTRIQSSGGTNTWKYYISGVCPSVSGTTYNISVWIKNQGTTSMKVSGNIVDGPTIAPGTSQQVSFNEVGNGSSCAQLGLATVNVGDSFDILAFAPAITPSGGSNLIASGNLNFSGWNSYQGSSVTVTQGQAALTYDSMDYLPFGEQIAGGSGTKFKFTDDERDSETNLDHTWFRQYSSQLGRWMHPDPAGLAASDPFNPQSWNRYSYVMNNPLNLTDPTGLCGSSDDEISGCVFIFINPYTGAMTAVDGDGDLIDGFSPSAGQTSADDLARMTDCASMMWVNPCNGAPDEMAINMPNLAAATNSGGFLATDLFGALEASALNAPYDPSTWGYSVNLKNGVFQGGWSVDKWVTDARNALYLDITLYGRTYTAKINKSDPHAVFDSSFFNPNPGASFSIPTPGKARDYKCTAMSTELNTLQAETLSVPGIALAIANLQQQYTKACP